MVKDCLVEWSFLDEMSMICCNVASALPHGYRSSSDIHTFLVVLRFVVSLCCGESGIILFSDCIRNLIVCKARWAQTIRVSQTVVTLAFSVEPLALCIDNFVNSDRLRIEVVVDKKK